MVANGGGGADHREHIAILGGGIAGLTAAFYLTETPELRDKYRVTLYQMGWRLGGKCATGRGVFDRIEEHGIHGFLGSYFNGLGLLSACYEEISSLLESGALEGGVLPSFATAMRPADEIILWEWIEGQMKSWPFALPPNDLDIATTAQFKTSLERAKTIMGHMIDLGHTYYDDRINPETASDPIDIPRSGWVATTMFLIDLLFWVIRRRRKVGLCYRLLGRAGVRRSAWRTFLSWIFSSANVPISVRLRRLRVMANFAFTVIRGVFNKDYNLFRDGFEGLEDYNYIDWLKRYGLTEESESAPIAINTIDISYNFPDGDNSRQPLFAAGTYLRWTLRSLLTLRSIVWAFEAGTGETMIAPLYMVLKHRGVEFEFFHKVAALRLSEDTTKIASVEVDIQAEPLGTYDPLIRVQYDPERPDGYLRCWPNVPRYELLKNGEAMKQRGDDLETYWAPPSPYGKKTLVAGTHFDKIVFAISVGAVPYLFPELNLDGAGQGEPPQAAKWRAMIAGAPACATQTLQVWFTKSSEEMGAAALDQDSPRPFAPISGTFVAPFNGQADFTHLIGYEGWRDKKWHRLAREEPKSVWYFSGALTLRFPGPSLNLLDEFRQPIGDSRATASPLSDAGFPLQQNERVFDFAAQFLQATAGYLLPDAKRPWQPLGLDFDVLKGLDPAGDPPDPVRKELVRYYRLAETPTGVGNLQNQFWQANVEPTERYVQCPPGGVRARLAADGSGFDNMVLAGDWIDNHLNIGSVEGAVMGGKLAARALCGSPALDDIVGYGRPGVAA